MNSSKQVSNFFYGELLINCKQNHTLEQRAKLASCIAKQEKKKFWYEFQHTKTMIQVYFIGVYYEISLVEKQQIGDTR